MKHIQLLAVLALAGCAQGASDAWIREQARHIAASECRAARHAEGSDDLIHCLQREEGQVYSRMVIANNRNIAASNNVGDVVAAAGLALAAGAAGGAAGYAVGTAYRPQVMYQPIPWMTHPTTINVYTPNYYRRY